MVTFSIRFLASATSCPMVFFGVNMAPSAFRYTVAAARVQARGAGAPRSSRGRVRGEAAAKRGERERSRSGVMRPPRVDTSTRRTGDRAASPRGSPRTSDRSPAPRRGAARRRAVSRPRSRQGGGHRRARGPMRGEGAAERDGVLEGGAGAGADGEVDGAQRVAEQDDPIVVPTLVGHHPEAAPGRSIAEQAMRAQVGGEHRLAVPAGRVLAMPSKPRGPRCRRRTPPRTCSRRARGDSDGPRRRRGSPRGTSG